MNAPLLFHSVLSRLWRHKGKTLFMGLGIMVAVLATVLLQAVLGSVNAAFDSFIERAYPADGIVVMAGGGFMTRQRGPANLQLADVETIAATLGITEWDPIVFIGFRDVRHEGNNTSVSIVGLSEVAEGLRRRSAQEGEFFSPDEVRGKANVALLGSTTAKTLFPGRTPVGAHIFIDNIPFEVKGVLETVGVDPHGLDQDHVIWLPYTTVLQKMLKRDAISGAMLSMGDPGRVEEAKEEIAGILRERHQIGEGQEDDFSIVTPTFMRDLRARSARTWNIFVPLIAGTSFLISTIVILSIMQISIKGRIPEIGLRKAVGARSRDLQVQIILEVLLVAVVASLIGLVLAQIGSAALTPMLAAKFGVKKVSAPVLVVIIAVGAALATALLGGIWPARRVAKLDPVEALR